MRILRLVLLLLLSMALVPACLGAVSEVTVYPTNAKIGDPITLSITASPDEKVPIVVEFDGVLSVNAGVYYTGFTDIELTSSNNRLTVDVSDVLDLDLTVKYLFVTYISREFAVDGSASITRNNAPISSYDISISGNAQPGVASVPVHLIIEVILTMDLNGEYHYELDTKTLSVGTFSFNVDGTQLSATIEEEKRLPVPNHPVNPPEPDVDESLSPEEIALEMQDYSTSELSLLFNYTDDRAALILESLSVEKAVDFISNYNASRILDLVNSNRTVEVISALDNVTAGLVMNRLDPEKAGQVILQGNTTTSVSVLGSMVVDNVTSAAIRVEHAIKNRNNETEPSIFLGKTQKLEQVFNQFDPGALVSLFESIAKLPHTPSTVADLFEIMGVTHSIPVVKAWVKSGDLETLGLVFGFFSPDYGANLYQGVNDTTVFLYLTNETVALLPETSSFVVKVAVTPEDLIENEVSQFSVLVENVGVNPGHKIIEAFLDGEKVIEEWVILCPGENRTFRYETQLDAGMYVFNYLGGSVDIFVPALLTSADIHITEILYPTDSLVEGDEFNLTVHLTNLGELSGDFELDITLDEVHEYSGTISIDGVSDIESLHVFSNLQSGSHSVDVNGDLIHFEVSPKSSAIPWVSFEVFICTMVLVVYLFRIGKF